MNPYVLLAKQAIENYVKEGESISLPDDLPEEFLKRKAGTFVTIMRNDDLRGCIGTYLPIKENVAKEIIANAIAAAAEDYRFGPIQKEELPRLSYTVYILSEPELVKDIKELNPKKYGLIVKTVPISRSDGTDVVFNEFSIHFTSPSFNGYLPLKSGLLLPDLEGIDTIEKQISIACQKGGINPAQEQLLIYKFSVEKYI